MSAAHNEGDKYQRNYCVSDYLDDVLMAASEWVKENSDVVVDDVIIYFSDGQWYAGIYWVDAAKCPVCKS